MTIATRLLHQKKSKDLMQLLEEHGKNVPGDPYHPFYFGELYLLRGDVRQAARYFSIALKNAPRENDWTFRNGLFRVRIKERKAAEAYAEAGRGQYALEQLASLCVAAGDIGQLESLLRAAKGADLDESIALFWQVEIEWLKKDHEAVLKLLTEHRASLFGQMRHRWKLDSYLVRCLVRSKKTREAVQEAEVLVNRRSGDRLLLILAHAANGDVKSAGDVLAGLGTEPYHRQRCYQDEASGPLLRTEAFRAFRERLPNPKKEPDKKA